MKKKTSESFDWTKEQLDSLGKETDSKIAHRFGIPRIYIYMKREELGIPNHQKWLLERFEEEVRSWSDEKLRGTPRNFTSRKMFKILYDERKRRGMSKRSVNPVRGIRGQELIRLLVRYARTLNPPVTYQALADLFGVSRQRMEQLTRINLKV